MSNQGKVRVEPPIVRKDAKEIPLVLIAGMGPGGITAAIEALKKGYRVRIVEKRDNFYRGQELFLEQSIPFLQSLKIKPNPDSVEEKKAFEEIEADEVFFYELNKKAQQLSVDSQRPVFIPYNKLQEFLLRKFDPDGTKQKQGILYINQLFKEKTGINLTDLIRGDKIVLNKNIILFLQSLKREPKSERERELVADIAFFRELSKSDESLPAHLTRPATVALNKLQEFLLRKLDPDGSKQRKELLTMSKLPKITEEIIDFNLKGGKDGKNLAKIKSAKGEELLQFDYFVAADGASRLMSAAINRAWIALTPEERLAREKQRTFQPPFESKDMSPSLPTVRGAAPDMQPKQVKAKELITYHDLATQYRSVPQASLFLRSARDYLKVGDKQIDPMKVVRDPMELGLTNLTPFTKLGWMFPFKPNQYIISNSDYSVIYIATEIPQAIFDIRDTAEKRRRLEAWGKLILKEFYNVTDAHARFELDVTNNPDDKGNDLRATTFVLNLKYAETPLVELDDHTLFACIGDAYMNANFYHGHGTNDAIQDGIDFAKALPVLGSGNKFDGKTFIEERVARKNRLIDTMKLTERGFRGVYGINWTRFNFSLIKNAKELLVQADDLLDVEPSLVILRQDYAKLLEKMQDKMRVFTELERNLDEGKISKESIPEYLTPHSVDLDILYEKTIEYSEAIDKAIDKAMAVEKRKSDEALRPQAVMVTRMERRAGQENKGVQERKAQTEPLPLPQHLTRESSLRKQGSVQRAIQNIEQKLSDEGLSTAQSVLKVSSKPGSLKKPVIQPAQPVTQPATTQPSLAQKKDVHFAEFSKVAAQLNQVLNARFHTYEKSLLIRQQAGDQKAKLEETAKLKSVKPFQPKKMISFGLMKKKIAGSKAEVTKLRGQSENLEFQLGIPKNKIIDRSSNKWLTKDLFNEIKELLALTVPYCRVSLNAEGQIEFSGNDMILGINQYADMAKFKTKEDRLFTLEVPEPDPKMQTEIFKQQSEKTLKNLFKNNIAIQAVSLAKTDKKADQQNLYSIALEQVFKEVQGEPLKGKPRPSR